MIPFTGRKEREVNKLMQKEAGFLATAIFNYDFNSNLGLYICYKKYLSTDKSEEALYNWQDFKRSSRGVAKAFKVYFLVNLNIAVSLAKQLILNTTTVKAN
jgi:hypothetical protein